MTADELKELRARLSPGGDLHGPLNEYCAAMTRLAGALNRNGVHVVQSAREIYPGLPDTEVIRAAASCMDAMAAGLSPRLDG